MSDSLTDLIHRADDVAKAYENIHLKIKEIDPLVDSDEWRTLGGSVRDSIQRANGPLKRLLGLTEEEDSPKSTGRQMVGVEDHRFWSPFPGPREDDLEVNQILNETLQHGLTTIASPVYPAEEQAKYEEWSTTHPGTLERMSFEMLYDLCQNYPANETAGFLPYNPKAPTLDSDQEVPAWSFFRTYVHGIQMNVPVPFLPQSAKKTFYDQSQYLFRVARPFEPAEGLVDLTESTLIDNYGLMGRRGPGWLAKEIRQSLGRGKCVVVKNCSTHFDDIEIDPSNYLFNVYTFRPETEIEAQDLHNWPEQLKMPFGTFWNHRFDPGCIMKLLDMNRILVGNVPLWTNAIYDDSLAIHPWTHDGTEMHIESIGQPYRMLCGHPFSYTPLRHMVTGLSTYVTTVCGHKLGFVLEWTKTKPTTTEWLERWTCLNNQNLFAIEWSTPPPWIVNLDEDEDNNQDGRGFKINWELYDQNIEFWDTHYRVARWAVIDIAQGTTLILPPETPHWMYDTQFTLAVGGHGLLWEALPLTVMGCRMDNMSSHIAKDAHATSLMRHSAMAVTLPNDPSQALWPGRPGKRMRDELEAIARLVLLPENYQQQREEGNPRYEPWTPPRLYAAAREKMQKYVDVLEIDLPASRPSPNGNVNESDFS